MCPTSTMKINVKKFIRDNVSTLRAEVPEEIKKEIDSLKSKNNKVPGLTVILIGDFAPSQIYVKKNYIYR